MLMKRIGHFRGEGVQVQGHLMTIQQDSVRQQLRRLKDRHFQESHAPRLQHQLLAGRVGAGEGGA